MKAPLARLIAASGWLIGAESLVNRNRRLLVNRRIAAG